MLPFQTVGTYFLTTPIFRVQYPKIVFFIFTITCMWHIEIAVFDAAESIPELYFVAKEIVLTINCIEVEPIFRCRD